MKSFGNCPACKKGALKVRIGQFGGFIGCSQYPDCPYTTNLEHVDQIVIDVRDEYDVNCIDKLPWVNASSIGETAFCPQSYYLRRQGIKPDQKALDQMALGNVHHRRISTDHRCYIATYVFNEEHPVVWSLRRWRDDALLTTCWGKVLVLIYYKISPILIRWVGSCPWFHQAAKKIILKIVTWLEIE